MSRTHVAEIRPLIPVSPVVGSRVSWQPGSESCEIGEILTSVDSGITWQPAENGRPVPGLNAGDQPDEVRAKAVLNLHGDGPKWRMPDWNVRVACDSAHFSDEVGGGFSGIPADQTP